MKRVIKILVWVSMISIAGCMNESAQEDTHYTGELRISGNKIYITDCSSGVKYEVTGNTTELISGTKDRIAEGDNQVFAQITGDTLGDYKLQLNSIEAFLNQPPASCSFHMGYLSTLANANWTVTADDKDLRFEMNKEEYVLYVDGDEILFPPVNARITHEYLEYDSSTLWNDNQSFIRVAIMPRACENSADGESYYAVITLNNELIKACASQVELD